MSRWQNHDRGGAPGQLRQSTTDPKRWQLRVSQGYDPLTRKRRKDYTETFYGGKKQAEARLNELVLLNYQKQLKPRSNMTLEQLADAWLEAKDPTHATSRTRTGYRKSFDNHILPSLGKAKVTDLEYSDIETLYQAMREGTLPPSTEEGKGWRGGKLSVATIRQAHAALRQALRHAVREKVIRDNPADLVELPRPDGQPVQAVDADQDGTQQRHLKPGELVRFLEACHSSYYGIFYRLLAETGLRPGEACALTWPDVDLNEGTIRVNKAVTKGANGERVVRVPKTTRSRRVVYAPPALLEALRRHHGEQQSLNLDESGHVFVTPDGNPLAPWRHNRRDLKRVLVAAGVKPKGFGLYNLRHTFASTLNESGADFRATSDLMGHATVKMTQDAYTHTDADARRAAALKRAKFVEAEAKRQEAEASMSN